MANGLSLLINGPDLCLDYECPALHLAVQAESKRAGAADDGQICEAVYCIACGNVHLVNPATGRIGLSIADATSMSSASRNRIRPVAQSVESSDAALLSQNP